jgi:hypothetical protein
MMKRSILILALLVLGGCHCSGTEYKTGTRNGKNAVMEYSCGLHQRCVGIFDSYAEADSVCRELNERLEERDGAGN